ncbi:NEDD8-conjugating protein ubc12 [Malassezia sp. CBS 17886]|nr:NEDD8-conjugating protein ubc12 [Malassezia sp. CBS 17886]
MINLWSQKKEADEARRQRPKTSPAQLRVQKDLTELALPDTMRISFPDPTDTMHFLLTITPDEGGPGMYEGGVFRFDIAVNQNYPHDPPKVKCVQKLYHPNLDLDGNVCLNILREEWNPILNLNSVLVGLQFLFLDPNADDPLNKGVCRSVPAADIAEAAEELRRDRTAFAANVKRALSGATLQGVTYDRVV